MIELFNSFIFLLIKNILEKFLLFDRINNKLDCFVVYLLVFWFFIKSLLGFRFFVIRYSIMLVNK